MPSAPHGTTSPPKAVPRARLNSWKEIADYLSKGERTAKRWENERSLPVHHVPGGGHGSVYAFTAELDGWLLSQKPKDINPDRIAVGQQDRFSGSALRSLRIEPVANTLQTPASALARTWTVRVRRILPYTALFFAIVLLVFYSLNLHTTSAYTSYLRSLLAKTQSSSSDPDKQLAHELYLRGRFEWNKRTPDSLNRALDYFTQAVVHDPDSAQAYVGLADTYILLREYTLMPEAESYARAAAAAKKAIALDDSLAEAHRSLAFDEIWGNWDFEAGEKEFQRAIELNPEDPVTHLWFANAFAAPGWYAVCLREINRAQELDPSSYAILADKGLLLFHAGQTKQGLELVKQVEQTDPDFLSPHRYLASMYLTLRDYPNFLAESEKSAELSHDQVLKDTLAAARLGFQRNGERGLLHEMYIAQKKFHEEGKLSGTILAMTCARMGKKEEALQLLRDDYDKHDAKLLMFRDNADLLTLRNEPGYQDLLRKVHSPVPTADAATSVPASSLLAPNQAKR
jgi:tetratricopeptide (TPR) repeat protein